MIEANEIGERPATVRLVVRSSGRFYAMPAASAGPAAERRDAAQRHVDDPTSRWSRSRAHALTLAHNLERKCPSSHGVAELTLKKKDSLT